MPDPPLPTEKDDHQFFIFMWPNPDTYPNANLNPSDF